MSEKPKCLNCGKQLGKMTGAVYGVGDLTPDPQWHGRGTRTYKVLEILRRKKDWRGKWVLSVWYGKWGRNGDGLFCGTTCGYQYAVRTNRDSAVDNSVSR